MIFQICSFLTVQFLLYLLAFVKVGKIIYKIVLHFNKKTKCYEPLKKSISIVENDSLDYMSFKKEFSKYAESQEKFSSLENLIGSNINYSEDDFTKDKAINKENSIYQVEATVRANKYNILAIDFLKDKLHKIVAIIIDIHFNVILISMPHKAKVKRKNIECIVNKSKIKYRQLIF